jgi:hypothetical protein
VPTSLPLTVDAAADRPSTGRRRRRISAVLMAGAIGLGVLAACEPPTPTPTTPTFTSASGIEAQIDDEPTFCDPANAYDKPGPQALRSLLNATYGTIDAGITRTCDGSVSDHHEGRALDWMVDYADPVKRAKALAVINWLRATDAQGNTNAVARRLGLSYWIYNKQMYGSWNNFNPTPYSCAGDATSCHVNHIHFSFTWAGAYKQVSFWRGSVLPTIPSTGTTFAVDSRSNAPVLAPAQLGSGRSYVVEVSGTYKYGTFASQTADAFCSQVGSAWTKTRSGATFGSSVLKLKIGGGYGVGGTTWTPVTNNGSGCNTADHRYRMTVRSWSALPITALVLDGRNDNSGSLTVRITPA